MTSLLSSIVISVMIAGSALLAAHVDNTSTKASSNMDASANVAAANSPVSVAADTQTDFTLGLSY